MNSEALRKAYAKTAHDIEQTLGKALGFPEYTSEFFPNGKPDGSVCVGDHSPESLAEAAANEIYDLRKQLEVMKSCFCDKRIHYLPEGMPRITGKCYMCEREEWGNS